MKAVLMPCTLPALVSTSTGMGRAHLQVLTDTAQHTTDTCKPSTLLCFTATTPQATSHAHRGQPGMRHAHHGSTGGSTGGSTRCQLPIAVCPKCCPIHDALQSRLKHQDQSITPYPNAVTQTLSKRPQQGNHRHNTTPALHLTSARMAQSHRHQFWQHHAVCYGNS
jgi:hypothetical protein